MFGRMKWSLKNDKGDMHRDLWLSGGLASKFLFCRDASGTIPVLQSYTVEMAIRIVPFLCPLQ